MNDPTLPSPPNAEDDDGPECETCGKTTCPDADLPGFSEPQACAYLPIYNELRYDRCEYGCGRDITKASIQRDIVPTVDALLAAARADERERLALLFEQHDRDGYLFLDGPLPGHRRVPWLNVAWWLRHDAAHDLAADTKAVDQ